MACPDFLNLQPTNSLISGDLMELLVVVPKMFQTEGLPTRHCPDFPAQWGVVNDWSDLEKARCLELRWLDGA